MPHSNSGACRTPNPEYVAHFVGKEGERKNSWLIENMACYLLEEQGGGNVTGAINHEEDQGNTEIKARSRIVEQSNCGSLQST